MHLYGIAAPLPNVREVGELNSGSKQLQSQWQRVDAVVMEIPLALTLSQAIKQLRKLLNEKSFAAALPQSVAPKYQLMPSKLRIETLPAGVDLAFPQIRRRFSKRSLTMGLFARSVKIFVLLGGRLGRRAVIVQSPDPV